MKTIYKFIDSFMSFIIIKSDRKGSAAVEFGLVLPFLLILLIAIIEYGWYFTHEIVLENAVTEGARRAIKHMDDDNAALNAALEGLKEGFWLRDLTENDEINTDNIIISGSEDKPKRIIVTVPTLEFKDLTGFLPEGMLPTNLGAKAVMTFP